MSKAAKKIYSNFEIITASSGNPYDWYNQSWESTLSFEEVLHMEVALFNELFVHVRGIEWDEALIPYFKTVIKKVCPQIEDAEHTIVEKRYNVIFKIYAKHSAAIKTHSNIKNFYILMLEMYDITKSEKRDYISKLFGLSTNSSILHNAKYKLEIFRNVYNSFREFWDGLSYNELISRKDFVDETSANRKLIDDSIIGTIAGLQEERGFDPEKELVGTGDEGEPYE